MRGKSVILIVDDSEFGRETLGSLLSNVDYELHYAGSGAEAISLAEQLVPDLVLLDVMMPGMNGFDACRKLRSHPQLAEVPVILVTALDDRASRLEGLDAGADDFISKPVDRAELRVRVRTVTRLNRYRRLLNERLRFDWVVEKAQEGYLLLGQHGAIHYANQSARLLLGLRDIPLPAPISLYDFVQRTFHCEPEAEWLRWFGPDGRLPTGDLFLVRSESETTPLLWLQISVLGQDERFNMEQLVHIRDVTAQVTTQRATWAFHSMIMHKLNTPLQTVMGGLEMLSPNNIDELSAKEIGVLANLAFRGAKRLSGAIADILKYVKAPVIAREGERMILADLPALATQIGNLLGVKSELHADESLDARMLSLSPRAVESILWELLDNAQKFHPNGLPSVYISLTAPSDELHLKLMDDGKTLSPTEIARVWTPYYQAEKHFTGEMPGMGLGLPMVATMVWEAGGRCTLYNRSDKPGVVVELWLPINQHV